MFRPSGPSLLRRAGLASLGRRASQEPEGPSPNELVVPTAKGDNSTNEPFVSRSLLNRAPRPMETSIQGTQLMHHDRTTYGDAHRDISNQKALLQQPIDFEGKDMSDRRWLRDPSETCVREMKRSDRLFTDYVGHFKMDDPQWRKMMQLPCGNPISLEVKSRHINYALKHLAQGQGEWTSYYLTKSVHSVLHPKGVSERCYVTCRLSSNDHFTEDQRSPEGKLPGLNTTILHEGPLDAAEPNGARGIVAVSFIGGLAGNFERREQLWMRARRTGAMQSEMGVYDYKTSYPPKVGCNKPYEVMLLEPHVKHIQGGIQAVGFVSSHNMAQHEYHYVHNFEVPAGVAVDAIKQLCHRSALESKLVLPDEKMHWLAWRCEARFPFAPIEMDLHFHLQASTPQVYTNKDDPPPPQGAVGGPMLQGPALQYRQFDISVGKPDYHFEDGAAQRGWNWWHQRKEYPLVGDCWTTRDAHLDKLEIVTDVENPFEDNSMKNKLERRAELHFATSPKHMTKVHHRPQEDREGEEEPSSPLHREEGSSFERTHVVSGEPLDPELQSKVQSRKQRMLASLKRHKGQR